MLLFGAVFMLFRNGLMILDQKILHINFHCTTDLEFLKLSSCIIISNLAWFITIQSVFPQYTSFGSQSYCTGTQNNCNDRPDLVYACQFSSPQGIIFNDSSL